MVAETPQDRPDERSAPETTETTQGDSPRPSGRGVAARRRQPASRRETRPSPPPIPDRADAPDQLIIGRVAAPHGLRGEFHMVVITNHPDYLRRIRTVYLGEPREAWRVTRMHAAPDGKVAVVKLANVGTTEEAAALRGQLVWIDRADAPPLPEGEYYHYQLLGLDVVDESDAFLGRLAEIIETGANDVYVVRGPAGEILLPVIESCILSIDLEHGRVVVRPPEYL